jgi:transposase
LPFFCLDRDIAKRLPSSSPLKRGRKASPKALPGQITGRNYLRILQDYLARLGDLYPHPNRVLFFDDVVVAYVLAFFNPVLRSLRLIEHASQMPGVNRFLEVEAVCKSTLSDANALFDPAHLHGLLGQLRRHLPNLPRQDRQLEQLLQQVIIHDGSFFRVAADVAWAIHSSNQHYKASGSHVRLNCQFCLKSGVPCGVSVNGSDGVGEGAAASVFVEPGRIYLFDGGVVSFDLLQKILAADSNFLCNLSPGVNFQAVEQRTLGAGDVEAGVLSDRVGKLTGSDTRQAPDALLREVTVAYVSREGKGKTLRLLTTLLDLPAHRIAELYRYRWQIELFFRWLKVHANFQHLTSHSRKGMTLSFYVAVIAALLMCLRTQKPLSLYGYNLLSMVAMGLGDVSDMLPILEQQERQSRMERERKARKRAAKKDA